jgi:hypothetical protein
MAALVNAEGVCIRGDSKVDEGCVTALGVAQKAAHEIVRGDVVVPDDVANGVDAVRYGL